MAATVIGNASALDVQTKYLSLLKDSWGADSPYTKAKENFNQLALEGDLKDIDKAKIFAEMLSSISNTIISSSMSTALQWAAKEEDSNLKRLELEQQLELLLKDQALKDAQIAQMGYENTSLQANTWRNFGVPTIDANGKLLSLTDTGKVFAEIAMIDQQVVNLTADKLLTDAKTAESQASKLGIDANTSLTGQKEVNLVTEEVLTSTKIKETQASVHKLVADAYTNYGSMSYTLADTGLSVTATADTTTSLANYQKEIAIEQAKGYTYQAWANAASTAGNAWSTAVGAGQSVTDYAEINFYRDMLAQAVQSLNSATTTTTEVSPTAVPTV